MIIRGLTNIKAHMSKCQKTWPDYSWDGYGFGGNIVGDHDEDYVIDALWDIPNR